MLTQTNAKGEVTTYPYDALNRVTLITFHDGSKQTYAYDQHGRVTSETRTLNGVAYVLGYGYDTSGRLAGLTYPSGRTVTYGFDALGRVNQVSTTKESQSQVVVQNVAYHPFGSVKSFTLGNGQINRCSRIKPYLTWVPLRSRPPPFLGCRVLL